MREHALTLKSNAEELALIAQEIGAEVIRGPVRHPSEMGDFAVGAVGSGEYLYELKGKEVVLMIAPVGPAEELPLICGLCGRPYDRDERPTYRAEHGEAKRVIEESLRFRESRASCRSLMRCWTMRSHRCVGA